MVRDKRVSLKLYEHQQILANEVDLAFVPYIKCFDHLGNGFLTIKDMCEAWNVSQSAYIGRTWNGWTVEEALTGKRPSKVFDHLGKGFPSVSAMCEAWGVNRNTYNHRIKIGWTVEEALTRKGDKGLK